MNTPLKKYVIIASTLILLWLGFLIYIYTNFTMHDDVVNAEILANSREVGQQAEQIFTWFNNRQEVYVKTPKSNTYALPPTAEIKTLDGRILTMPIPIELVGKLKNQVENGVNIRFISNFPKNAAHIPTSDDNRAMINMVSEQKNEYFTFQEQENRYHYIRPIFAQENCITCHSYAQVNELIGGFVVETDPEEYIFYARYERVQLFILGLAGSSLGIFIFYFIIVHIWRRYRTQGENLEYAKSMMASMSQGTEVVISNIERIIKELSRGTNDPTKAELLRTLHYMNEDLLQSSQALATGTQAQRIQKEELIHVDTFFRQCVQIFHAQCQEKALDLSLTIDASVPIHVLGDAFHLRQVMSLLLKNAVDNTHSGGVRVRIGSALDIASHFSTKDLQHTPIHLLMEIVDTSKGYIISEQQNILQNFANKKRSKTFNDRTVIDLRPISKITAMLNGSVTVPHNGKTGACFLATAQVKMLDDEIHPQQDTVQSPESIASLAALVATQEVITPTSVEAVEKNPHSQASAQANTGVEKHNVSPSVSRSDATNIQFKSTNSDTPDDSNSLGASGVAGTTLSATKAPTSQQPTSGHAMKHTTPATPSAPSREVALSEASVAKAPSSTPVAALTAPPVAGVPESTQQNMPELPHNVRAQGPVLPEQPSSAHQELGPIHVIIGDSNVQNKELTPDETEILDKANIHVRIMTSGVDIFELLDTTNHEYSVVLLRELSDMDIIYTATRIRYLERLGSKPVAIVLMAENMVQGDMDVLRYFNVSTVDNFPRDAHIAAKVIHLALRTKNEQIFLGGQLYNKTNMEGDTTQIFDLEASLKNSKKDAQFVKSICSMWVRFYPEQLKRLHSVIKEGTQEEKLRVMRALRNSASTVSLPMLWEEATRMEEKVAQEDADIRYEKLLSIYEQTYQYLKENIGKIR